MHYSAAGCEFHVNESTIYIEWCVFKQTHIKQGYVSMADGTDWLMELVTRRLQEPNLEIPQEQWVSVHWDIMELNYDE